MHMFHADLKTAPFASDNFYNLLKPYGFLLNHGYVARSEDGARSEALGLFWNRKRFYLHEFYVFSNRDDFIS